MAVITEPLACWESELLAFENVRDPLFISPPEPNSWYEEDEWDSEDDDEQCL